MIKDLMTFPLAVDTATVKATTDVGYSATDEELNAYTIGFIPYDMIESSLFYRAAQIGTLKGKNDLNQNNYFGYTVDQNFASEKGIPFCYSYASNAMAADLNAYYSDADEAYINTPWGTATTTGLIHSYDVDTIINDYPNTIEETTGITALFKMFALYVPDDVDTSQGVWSTTNGENGWCTRLADKTATIDVMDLTFSVASGTDGGYMPTPVTFTEEDLENAVNGIMIKSNGTTSYGGVTYNIFVHCIISNAYLEQANAMNLKNGIAQLDKIRYSGVGGLSTPYYSTVASGYTVQNVFTCGVIEGIDLDLPGSNGYYMLTSSTGFEYFRSGSDVNNLLSGGFTVSDLKILRSVARPVYKISGAFYVAEFNDDYTITGDLIPYAQARAWQKFINPDNNTFDYNDIPDPSPEPSDWGYDRYGSVPGLWLGSDGITANFITPWVLKGSQVTNFGQFLWTNLFLPDPDDPSIINGLWQNFKDALGTYWQTGSFDPASTLDFVVSLMYYPFKLDSMSSDSDAKTIFFGTGVAGLTVSSSYNTRKLSAYHGWINGGGLNLADNEVKASLGIPDDFRGLANTSACIYLPFCGTYQVNWADIKDSSLTIYYAIDFTTGACTVYVISSKSGLNTYVLTATGRIGFSVPLSATNANRIISSIVGGVAQSGTKFLDMGSDIGTKILTGTQADKMSQVGGGSDDDIGSAMTLSIAGGPIAGTAIGGSTLAGKATKELFSKPSIGIPTMDGGSGWDALHCPRTPYLQVRTPQYVPDAGHGHALGWPAEKQADTIGSLPTPDASNYYECINVDTSTLTCTHEERQMIKQQLESGFYIRAE